MLRYHTSHRQQEIILVILFMLSLPLSSALGQADDPLVVCVSTSDLASLAQSLGGDLVTVTTFCKGPEDPHVIEIRPSFVKTLNEADLFIQVGLGIENAWLKQLMRRIKNPVVSSGQKGHLNLGAGVRRLESDVPDAIPNSFHEEGNPHYLLDPVEGLKAAKLICDRFLALRPEQRAAFEANHSKFVRHWAQLYFGKKVAGVIDLALLEDFESQADLETTLRRIRQRHQEDLAGILGVMLPFAQRKIVGDHDLWPYFARRFQLEVLNYLEPEPGISPTTKHLNRVIQEMKSEGVSVILTAPYFPIRHAQFVSKHTDATIVPMAHQTAAYPDADSYLGMLTYNVLQLAKALKE